MAESKNGWTVAELTDRGIPIGELRARLAKSTEGGKPTPEFRQRLAEQIVTSAFADANVQRAILGDAKEDALQFLLK